MYQCSIKQVNCEEPAVKYFELFSRLAFRCKNHLTGFSSMIYSEGDINENGEMDISEQVINDRIES
jgi:hypothetical protein